MTGAAAMRVAGPLAAACLAAACLAVAFASPPATAQAAGTPDPTATPQPGTTVRDPDFGVVARHFGLQRRVEMYQWRQRADGGYERAWSDDAVDSSAFAPGHDNPPFPLRNREWVAEEIRVDGLPLAPGVSATLGRWTPFRPSFSALPGNLAATFQPQGDGLGTAENPMSPEIGDLRVHWRELRLPPLGNRIVRDGDGWRLKDAIAADFAAGNGAAVAHREADGLSRIGRFVAFALVFLAGIAVARLWRRRR